MPLQASFPQNDLPVYDTDEEIQLPRYLEASARAGFYGSLGPKAVETQQLSNAGWEKLPQYGDEGELLSPGIKKQAMSLDDANKEGEPYGLRFSEPPTRAQFDMMAEHKQREINLNAILSRPAGNASNVGGFFASLAASAADPTMLALSLVPGLGEARAAELGGAALGRGGELFAQGFSRGATGMAALQPAFYALAQPWQDEYTLHDALSNVLYGGLIAGGFHVSSPALSAGLGWLGRPLSDWHEAYKGAMARTAPTEIETGEGFRTTSAELRAGIAGAEKFAELPAPEAPAAPDLRKVKTPAGETPYIIDALDPEVREGLTEAAIKSVANDKFPLIDKLLEVYPEAEQKLMTSPRYPSQIRLANSFTPESFYDLSEKPQRMIENMLRARVKDKEAPKAEALFEHFKELAPELKDTNFKLLNPYQYDATLKSLLDYGVDIPVRQRAFSDEGANAITASEDTTLGQLHHQIQALLDAKQGFTNPDEAGGYRFFKDDFAGARTVRRADIENTGGVRAGAPSPADQLALFANSPELTTTPVDVAASERASDLVNSDKDKDLLTLIEEEEEMAREAVLHLKASAGRDLGLIEKVLSDEDRELLEPKAEIEAIGKGIEQEAKEALETAASETQQKALEDIMLIALYPHLADAVEGGRLPNYQVAGRLGRLIDEEGHMAAIERIEAEAGDDVAKANAIIDEEAAKAAQAEEAALAAEGLTEDQAQPEPEKPAEPTFFDAGEPDEATLNRIEENIVRGEQAELKASKRTKKLVSPVEEDLFNANAAWRARIESLDAFRGGEEDTQELTRARAGLEEGHPETALGPSRPTDGAIGRQAPEGSDGGAPSFGAKARSVELGVRATNRVITPDGSMEINVEPMILEREVLRPAEGAFQPRDRSRKEMIVEASKRAANLDPQQLMHSRVSDSGAPIVTKDGMVISGNGRFLSLGQAYDWARDGSRQYIDPYRAALGDAAADFEEPVFVYRIADDLSNEELIKFADRSNRGRIAAMSATERAQRDAQSAGHDVMFLYGGGDFTAVKNATFVNRFAKEVVTPGEMPGFSKGGELTQEGVQRLQNAVLAAAYSDPGALSIMMESADDNVRSLVGAYRDVASKFMHLRALVASGFVDKGMDITPQMTEAARIISKYRSEKRPISEWVNQTDAFNPHNPIVEGLIRSFYTDDLRRPISRKAMTEQLEAYADEAIKHKPSGSALFRDETTSQDVLALARRKAQANGANGEELAAGLEGNGGGTPEGRAAAPGQGIAESGEQLGANAGEHSSATGQPGAIPPAAAPERGGEPAGRGQGENENGRRAPVESFGNFRVYDKANDELLGHFDTLAEAEEAAMRHAGKRGSAAVIEDFEKGIERNVGEVSKGGEIIRSQWRQSIANQAAGHAPGWEEAARQLNEAPALDTSRPVNKYVSDFLAAGTDREAFLKVYNRLSEDSKLSREDAKRVYYALTGDIPGKQRLTTMLQGIEAHFNERAASPETITPIREDILRRLNEVQSGLPKKQVEGTSEFAAGAAQRLRDAKDLATWDEAVKSLKNNRKTSKPELLSIAQEFTGETLDPKWTKGQLWDFIEMKRPSWVRALLRAADQPEREMTDEEADRLPLRPEPEPKAPAFSLENRDRLYDLIDSGYGRGGKVGIRLMGIAKELGIGADEASELLDYMIDKGWLRYTKDDEIRPVSARQRPVRPMRGDSDILAQGREPPANDNDASAAQGRETLAGMYLANAGGDHDLAIKMVREDYRASAVRTTDIQLARREIGIGEDIAARIARRRDTGNRPFEFVNLSHDEFVKRLNEDPAKLDELAQADPMVKVSYNPEVSDRLMAIDRAINKRFAEKLSGVKSDSDERAGKKNLPPEAGTKRGAAGRSAPGGTEGANQGFAAAGRVPSKEPFTFPGFTGSFKELLPHEENGVKYPSRIYRLHDEKGQAAEMKLRQAPGGRLYTYMVDIRRDLQHRGIGNEFGDAVAEHMGGQHQPTGFLTRSGYRSWLRRDPETVKYHRWSEPDREWLSPKQIEKLTREEPDNPHYKALLDSIPEEGKTPEALEHMFQALDPALRIPHWDPLREASAIKTRAAIETVAKKLPAAVRWGVMDSLRDPRTQYVSGITHPYEHLIEIADNLRRPLVTAYHEAIEAAKQYGLFTQGEWNILTKASKAGNWIKKYNIEQRYPGYQWRPDSLERFHKEAIAEDMAHWLAKKQKPQTAVEMLYDRIQRFFESIRNWMDGNGFTSAQGLFEAVKRGDLADRPVRGEVAGGGYSLEDQLAMMRRAFTAPEEDPMKRGNAIAEAAQSLANCMIG